MMLTLDKQFQSHSLMGASQLQRMDLTCAVCNTCIIFVFSYFLDYSGLFRTTGVKYTFFHGGHRGISQDFEIGQNGQKYLILLNQGVRFLFSPL